MDEGQLRRIYPTHIIRGCLGRRDSRFWPRQAVLHRRRCVSLLPGGPQANLGENSSCQQGLRDPPGCGEYPGDPETDQCLLSAVRPTRLSREPWSLEIPQVEELLLKIRHNGTALSEYSGQHPLIGIMPGLSEAYLVDTDTRNRLVQRDPKCTKLIKPYLRGQDLRRWHPEWAGLWMIAMGSSNDTEWPWASTTDETEAEEAFERPTRPFTAISSLSRKLSESDFHRTSADSGGRFGRANTGELLNNRRWSIKTSLGCLSSVERRQG